MKSLTSLSLPLPGKHHKFDALFAAAQSHAADAGYAFVNTKTKKGNSGRLTKVLDCKRGRIYRDPRRISDNSRKRNRTVSRCDCPVRIKALERPDDTWDFCHITPLTGEIRNPHNHNAADTPAAFTEHRKLNLEQLAFAPAAAKIDVKAAVIIPMLKQTTQSLNIVQPDLYNINAKSDPLHSGAMSPPEALISRLTKEKEENKVVFEREHDAAGHITFILFADRRSVYYLSKHPEIILSDCTYKTNNFEMPLLHVAGVNQKIAFIVTYSFLDAETEVCCLKAVRHIALHFPQNYFPSVFATNAETTIISV